MEEEESEKRFHSVMDKIFNTPKSNPTSRNQPSKGKKRGSSVLSEANELRGSSGLSRALVPAESLSSSSSQAPMCRPWDRGDFFRRLATFKSMTWFGKPKVVSAINCARRGWINVEMDIIACEACGARLLFSSPSSWTQQQVEKAAAVFSLKLDNGHKLHCPWIDNASDESLAQFPPTAAPALVDGYNKRCAALLQLSSLPRISSSAIGYMKCPQLECFLEQSSLHFAIESTNTSRCEDLDPDRATSADLYYQAQKLISLCGWEPRSLPYAVDCKDWSTKAAKNGHSEEMSQCVVNVQKPGVMYLTSGEKDVTNFEDPSLNALQSDPACTVLDCKLCGASAGLWAFSTVPRPLELFRINESLEVAGNRDGNVISYIAGASMDEPSGKNNHGSKATTMEIATSTKELLNSSIARGPPPAKQNYRATVSLPIITRHLGVVVSKANARSPLISNSVSRGHKTIQCNTVDSEDNDHATPSKPIVQSEDMGIFAPNENGVAIVSGDNTSYLNGDYPSKNDNNDESAVEDSQNLTQSPSRNGEYVRITENAEMGMETSSHGKASNAVVPDVNGSAETQNTNGISMAEVPIHQSVEVLSDTNMILSSACTMNSQKDDIGGTTGHLELEGVNNMQHTVSNEEASEIAAVVKDLERVQAHQTLDFDPVRQHRHFCPWIVSTGKAGPGWQQTLYALNRDKASPHPLPDSASPSKFEDDPVTSIRNLFQSPLAKRLKTFRSSS